MVLLRAGLSVPSTNSCGCNAASQRFLAREGWGWLDNAAMGDRDQFESAGAVEMARRRPQAEEFFRAVLDPEKQPRLVSDEATVRDLTSANDNDLIKRCLGHYGVLLEPKDFKIPLWRLLDDLEKHRRRSNP